MAFECPQCPDRSFISKTALLQHQRMATGHSFCDFCQRHFHCPETLERHKVTKQHFRCNPCNVGFTSQSSLEDHYRGKSDLIHPKCTVPHCGKGFRDLRSVAEHVRTAHPQTHCSCGLKIYNDILQLHYKSSPNHPSCIPCNKGFENDAAFDEVR
ncbi:hypothetical protein C8J57DRAFT_604942 [Mycena rebaudengoi]|nr:hypothetical protein C8J57DRAFT_604942 [Mycena rebaudengoi]